MKGGDRVIRLSTAFAVLGMAAVAAATSYEHAYDLVRAHGEAGWTARVIPLSMGSGLWRPSEVVKHLQLLIAENLELATSMTSRRLAMSNPILLLINQNR